MTRRQFLVQAVFHQKLGKRDMFALTDWLDTVAVRPIVLVNMTANPLRPSAYPAACCYLVGATIAGSVDAVKGQIGVALQALGRQRRPVPLTLNGELLITAVCDPTEEPP